MGYIFTTPTVGLNMTIEALVDHIRLECPKGIQKLVNYVEQFLTNQNNQKESKSNRTSKIDDELNCTVGSGLTLRFLQLKSTR